MAAECNVCVCVWGGGRKGVYRVPTMKVLNFNMQHWVDKMVKHLVTGVADIEQAKWMQHKHINNNYTHTHTHKRSHVFETNAENRELRPVHSTLKTLTFLKQTNKQAHTSTQVHTHAHMHFDCIRFMPFQKMCCTFFSQMKCMQQQSET